jgi:hypothetical protein
LRFKAGSTPSCGIALSCDSGYFAFPENFCDIVGK